MTATLHAMPTWLQVLLVCAATYSATRLLAVDTIAEPIRLRLERWAAEGDAALDKHRAPTRKQHAGAWLVELVSCPWCLSMWIGAVFALAWWQACDVAAPVLWVPVVALTARAFTGIVSLAVGRLEAAED